MSQDSRSGNISNAFTFDDIASANLYLSFNKNIKALQFLVLDIWQTFEASDMTDFDWFKKDIQKIIIEEKCSSQQNKGVLFYFVFD